MLTARMSAKILTHRGIAGCFPTPMTLNDIDYDVMSRRQPSGRHFSFWLFVTLTFGAEPRLAAENSLLIKLLAQIFFYLVQNIHAHFFIYV